MALDLEKARGEAATVAVHRHVADSMVFLVPGETGAGPAWVASGLLLQTKGGVPCVLTAAHNLDRASREPLRLGGINIRYTLDGVAVGIISEEKYDAGLIVLADHARAAVLRDCLPLERIAADSEVDAESDALVLAGFPGELSRRLSRNEPPGIDLGFTSVSYLTGVQADAPRDHRGWYRVLWTDTVLPDGTLKRMPNPEGISGGVLWRFRKVPKGALWHAAASGEVIGLASEWDRRETEFVVPSSRWLPWLREAAEEVDREFSTPPTQ